MEISGLLFDLDGTLVDSRQDLTTAVNLTRSDFGLEPVSMGEVVAWIGDGVYRLLEKAFPHHDSTVSYPVFLEHYEKHLCDDTALYPGVLDLLRISAVPMAIVTNKGQRFAEPLLAHLGIDSFFNVIVGGKRDVPPKPHPHLVLQAVNALGLEPEHVFLIGDSPQDILAAQAAGVRSIAVTYGFRSRDTLQGYQPDVIVDSVSDLSRVLAGLNYQRN